MPALRWMGLTGYALRNEVKRIVLYCSVNDDADKAELPPPFEKLASIRHSLDLWRILDRRRICTGYSYVEVFLRDSVYRDIRLCTMQESGMTCNEAVGLRQERS